MTLLRNLKLLLWACAAVAILILALVVIRVRTGGPSRASADNTGDGNQVVYAAVAMVKRQTVANSLSIAGQFVPYQNVELHAKEAGYIRNIYVDIGDRVHQGQVLAVLEIPELVAQVDASKAAVHHAEEEIQRAQSNVMRAQADNVALHANADRLVSADKARPGLIAQQELDDATAKDRASQAQVDAAKSALAAARQQLAVAKADQERYSALMDYSRIVAPYDGVVTWRFSDTGALVQAGTSTSSGLPVVTLAQVNVLRLRVPVPESLAAKVKIGDVADVQVQATGEHFTGKVSRFTDALDPSTRTMQVEIDVPNPSYHLQPGMYADVRLDANSRPDALTVPVEAIQRNDNKTSVLVVDPENRVQTREVKLGVQSSNKVEILAGLNEGEKVIVGNLGAYQPGEVVTPKPSVVASENPGKEAD
ncbi:efflux RND transporter periplasmic adaptor subunit [Paraburkholderia sp.]|uniref:efflux RND transporter periplasmic adaptor subunit n=1 Tax=Paraburkholderia sp. TaxID=1926495 RepID=UPI0025ED842B|nr:efflux RND transporter periplasmic adaptor subunit [Paraburkholderia sp.]